MRLFVAVRIPPLQMPTPIPRSPERHLTLVFLGERAPDSVGGFREALDRSVRGFGPFELTIAGGGSFPGPARPRVVWAGVERGRDELLRLRASVARELAGTGAALDDREFVPHVTLFRVRNRSDADLAAQVVERIAGQELGRTWVDEVILFESELRATGAEHRALASFRLLVPAPDAASARSA